MVLNKRKCLVTGGAGFIGSTLVDKLIALGLSVVVIDDLSSGKIEYINPKAKFYNTDISRADEINSIFADEKPDFVFHLAAQIDVRKSVSDPVFDNQINVIGGLNILDASLKNGTEKIIFSSTGGALYGGADIIPTPEDYPKNPLSPYGIHKLTFEKYLNYYHKNFGQKYISLRFANIYGPRQYKGGEAGVVSIFIDAAVNDKQIYINGDGLQTRDYTYVDDVVDAFVKAMESDFVGMLNISTQKESSLLEIVDYISSAIDKKILPEFRDANIGEERRSCLHNEMAKNILGWIPETDLQEGIRRTIGWSKNIINR